jgi:hypothetical protein
MTLQAQGSRGYGCMLLGTDEGRIPTFTAQKPVAPRLSS